MNQERTEGVLLKTVLKFFSCCLTELVSPDTKSTRSDSSNSDKANVPKEEVILSSRFGSTSKISIRILYQSIIENHWSDRFSMIYLCDCERNENAIKGLNLKSTSRVNDWNSWIIENNWSWYPIAFCISNMLIFPIQIHLWEFFVGMKCLLEPFDVCFEITSWTDLDFNRCKSIRMLTWGANICYFKSYLISFSPSMHSHSVISGSNVVKLKLPIVNIGITSCTLRKISGSSKYLDDKFISISWLRKSRFEMVHIRSDHARMHARHKICRGLKSVSEYVARCDSHLVKNPSKSLSAKPNLCL